MHWTKHGLHVDVLHELIQVHVMNVKMENVTKLSGFKYQSNFTQLVHDLDEKRDIVKGSARAYNMLESLNCHRPCTQFTAVHKSGGSFHRLNEGNSRTKDISLMTSAFEKPTFREDCVNSRDLPSYDICLNNT